MGTIANLITYVGASTNDFHRGIAGVIQTGGEMVSGFMKMGAAAGSALVGVGIAAGKMAIDFQDQMADVSTLIDGGPAEAMQRFGKDVKAISVATGKGLGDMANGLYETISAWGDSADAAQKLEIAAKAAVGGKAQTIDAVKLLSAVTKGYGDTSARAVQQVADLAFQTANLGQTTFPELAANIGETVPMANALGVKIEQLFGGFATLTGVTGNTSEVATQLKATFSALINPSTEMAAKLTKLGFANGKTAIETMGLQGTLDLLAKATGGNTAQLAKMFGSTEALNAVLALTGAQSADFTSKTQAMTQAAGAADTAFSKKSSSVASLWERLKQLGSVTLVNLGEQFLPGLVTAGEWIIDQMPVIQSTLEKAFSAMGVAVDALGKAFSWLGDTVFKPFVAAWNGDTASMETPVGKVATFVKKYWEDIGKQLSGFKDNVWAPFLEGWRTGNTNMPTSLGTAAALIGSIMSGIWELVKTIWGGLVSVWRLFGDDITAIAKTVWDVVKGVVIGALKIVDGVIKFFVALFKGDWQGMWKAIKQIWEGLWQIIVTVATGAWELLKSLVNIIVKGLLALWDGLVTAATAAWKWMWEGIKSITSSIWTSLSTAFSSVWTSISEWFTGLVDDAAQWFTDLWEGVKNNVTGAWTVLSTAFTLVWTSISGWFTGLVADAAQWFVDLWEGVKANVTGAWTVLSTAFTTLWTSLSGWFTGLVADAAQWFVDLWEGVKANVAAAWTVLSTGFSTLWTSVSGWFTGLAVDAAQWFVDLWEAVKTKVTGAWATLKTAFSTLWENIKGWFTGLATDALQWGKDVMSGFWDGLKSWFQNIWDGLKGFAKNVTDTVKGALGIHSPSKVFMGIGENIGAGLALGISASESMVTRSLADLAGGQVDVAMRSVGRGGATAGGYAGPREIRIPVTIGDQDLGEYVVDLLTGTVRQPKRAMGHA